jgi:hypothetical protein
MLRWGQAALEAEAVLEALGPHAEDDPELAAKARAAADRAVSAFNDAKGYIRHALNTSAGMSEASTWNYLGVLHHRVAPSRRCELHT